MDLKGLTNFRLRRVNPYRGLVIDEATWAEAHDYHRDHLRLHALAFHSPGVIAGLEVRPTPSQAGSVDVGPGVALDAEGNMIVVSQDRRVPLDDVEAGDVYLVLSYLENRVNAESGAPRGAPANRIVESYKIEAQNKLPEEPGLELARIHWSSVEAGLKQAADASTPGDDEIDLRFREAAHVARPATINIGVVGDSNPERHLGLSNLLREIDGLASYQARFRGKVSLEDGAGGSDLLYLSSAVDSETAVTTLASHLGRGGALLADACSSKDEDAFAGAIQHLAERLGLRLKPIKPNDELLNMRYPFAEPPVGASDGPIVASGRFVFSQRDYGCAWSSACEKTVLPRETVRAALEWGVNLAVASVQPLARGA
jgi:Domain of unknown function (DUF4159)